jgi:hypothetical protein
VRGRREPACARGLRPPGGARGLCPPGGARGLRPRRGALAVAALAVAALALVGCGAESPDLFLLTRAATGSGAAAHLTLLVNDGGTVRCNGGAARPLSGKQLLTARDLTTSIQKDAQRTLVLPAPPGALLRFHVRSQDGAVSFSDLDAARHPELAKVVAFTQDVAHSVCHLAQ